jgi:hypothetical protein
MAGILLTCILQTSSTGNGKDIVSKLSTNLYATKTILIPKNEKKCWIKIVSGVFNTWDGMRTYMTVRLIPIMVQHLPCSHLLL